jgi:hypothetical protein
VTYTTQDGSATSNNSGGTLPNLKKPPQTLCKICGGFYWGIICIDITI